MRCPQSTLVFHGTGSGNVAGFSRDQLVDGRPTATARVMRQCLATALCPVAFVVLAAASGNAALGGFAGSWEARYQGRLICTIKLDQNTKATGALYGCSFSVNQHGDLLEPGSDPRPDEVSLISNLRVEGNSAFFEIADQTAPMKLEFVLTGENQAELRFLEVPIKIKPIRFERAERGRSKTPGLASSQRSGRPPGRGPTRSEYALR